MKLKKVFYNLFFKKKRKPTGQTRSSRSNKKAGGGEKDLSIPSEPIYDLSGLRQQVSQSEYITNLRIGRSWILPQLVKMGFRKTFDGKWEFSIAEYEKAMTEKYNQSVRGRRELWDLIKRNYKVIADSDGQSGRAKWWTPGVAYEIMKWDFSLAGKARRGLDRNECITILNTLMCLGDAKSVYSMILRYDKNRMRRRKPLRKKNQLPDSFIDAFEGDGAYNAMMTMVKLMGLRIKGKTGKFLSQNASIKEIEKQAKELSGRKLMEYCKQTFFDSEVFNCERYHLKA